MGIVALMPVASAQSAAETASPGVSAEQTASASTAGPDSGIESNTAPTATATPSYAALADLLENDKSRTALIEQLRQLAGQQPASKAATDQAGPQNAEDPLGGLDRKSTRLHYRN